MTITPTLAGDGQVVTLAGWPAWVIEHTNRAGARWADLGLQVDGLAVVLVRVFPQTYDLVWEVLRFPSAITVTGRVDLRDGAASVVIASAVTRTSEGRDSR